LPSRFQRRGSTNTSRCRGEADHGSLWRLRSVVQRVLELATAVHTGRASIADLQTATAGAAGALDKAHAALRAALERLDSDLEMIRFTVDDAHQAAAIRRALEPVRDMDLS
jgi:hypothetical protein